MEEDKQIVTLCNRINSSRQGNDTRHMTQGDGSDTRGRFYCASFLVLRELSLCIIFSNCKILQN